MRARTCTCLAQALQAAHPRLPVFPGDGDGTRKLSAVLCERLDLAALLVQLQQRTEQALAA